MLIIKIRNILFIILTIYFSFGIYKTDEPQNNIPKIKLIKTNYPDIYINKNLRDWIEIHKIKTPLYQLENKNIIKKSKMLNPIQYDLIKLKLINNKLKINNNIKSKFVNYFFKNIKLSKNPISPYIYQEILNSNLLNTNLKTLSKNFLINNPQPISCPSKKIILEEINKYDINPKDFSKKINIIKKSNDFYFKKKYIKSITNKLNINQTKKFQDILKENTEKKINQKYLSKKSCFISEKRLKYILDNNLYKLKDIKKIANCYYKRGYSYLKNTINRWEKISHKYPLIFGYFKLKEIDHYKRFKYFSKAKTLSYKLLEFLDGKNLYKSELYIANLYSLSKIYKKLAKDLKSIDLLIDIANNYPDSNYFYSAIIDIILLKSNNYNWKFITDMEISLDLINSRYFKNLKKIDPYQDSLILFWIGRAYFEQNIYDKAFMTWEILANNFFSTFYGALGHYLIEKMSGNSYYVQPYHNLNFNIYEFYQYFNKRDQIIIERIEMLLELGLKKEALCEMREINFNSKNPYNMTVKALFLYAADQLLPSIKIFLTLPRDFRFSLPVGFERLFFPRKFDDIIEKFSKQGNIDPILVKSLIRQESVFNPRALSVAGARGIMQIMPKTAKHEIYKITDNYIDYHTKMKIKESIRYKKKLYNTKTNIIIGIHYLKRLIKEFKNPIISLAAYNAGPHQVKKWLENSQSHDLLLFIENIPFKETRIYVKLLLRNYFYYNRLYQDHNKDFELFDHLNFIK